MAEKYHSEKEVAYTGGPEKEVALKVDTGSPEVVPWQHYESIPVVSQTPTDKEAVTATSTTFSHTHSDDIKVASPPTAQELDGFGTAHTDRPRNVRRRVLLLIGLVILLLAIGLGVGLGVGLSTKNNNANAGTSAATVQTVSVTATVTGATPAGVSATATATSSAVPTGTTANTSCPGTNGTEVTASGTKYTIYCGSDLSGLIKSDLRRQYQPSFDACFQSCGQLAAYNKRSDVSAVYWSRDYVSPEAGTCWCLGNATRAAGGSVIPAAQNDLAWAS